MIIKFYKNDKGMFPVAEFFLTLPQRDQELINSKFHWVRKNDRFTRDFYTKFKGMNLDLGEFRINAYRIIVLRASSDMYIVLHAFRKKSNDTPERELKIAYNRAIDYLRRNQFQ